MPCERGFFMVNHQLMLASPSSVIASALGEAILFYIFHYVHVAVNGFVSEIIT